MDKATRYSAAGIENEVKCERVKYQDCVWISEADYNTRIEELEEQVMRTQEALGNMLDYYWGYRKNHGAHEITDDLAQKYQDELVECRR